MKPATACSTLLFILLLPAFALAADTTGQAATEADMKPYRERIGKWMEMVPIKGGKVLMGSPDTEAGRGKHEGPQFTVEIEPFWMGKYEVTWDDFALFQAERNEETLKNRAVPIPKDRLADAVSVPSYSWWLSCEPPHIDALMGRNGGYPVSQLSQFSAAQFTKWLSKKTGRFYRLPTEAEWEYAARAGSKTAYYWGDDPDHLPKAAWHAANSTWEDVAKRGFPLETDRYLKGMGYRIVGKLEANPWGLHDMYGNVGEWVIDAYAPDHYAKFAGKTVSWKKAILWPAKSTFPTVIRGGDFSTPANATRSASREASSKELQYMDPMLPRSAWWYTDGYHVGFRIVRPLKEPGEEKLKFWDHAKTLKEVKAVYDDPNASVKQLDKVVQPLKK